MDVLWMGRQAKSSKLVAKQFAFGTYNKDWSSVSFFTWFHDLQNPLLQPVASSYRKVLNKEKRSTDRDTSAGEEISLVRTHQLKMGQLMRGRLKDIKSWMTQRRY